MQFYEDLACYYDFICEDRKKDVNILTKIIEKHKNPLGTHCLMWPVGLG
ncbi:MAG: hypothetical protein PVF58_09130 [Candidatus Methanofastidiosia archaeon]